MTTVESVFAAAMGLMDELDPQGGAQSADTKDYERRAPAILNALCAELRTQTGEGSDWRPATRTEDHQPLEENNRRSAQPYGLAANLLVDENPAAASFYQQRYEELRAVYLARRRADLEDIELLYGGVEQGNFARW